jgi:diguanylate cyclase (GGDEF)-like protein
MRFIRMGALVGSLVLIITTLISIVNRRDDLHEAYDLQLAAASVLVTNGVESTLDRAVAIASVAPADIDPESLGKFAAPVDVCVIDGDGRADCTGDDLTQIEAYPLVEHELADRAGDATSSAVAVVDGETGGVLVVGGDEHTIAMLLSGAALLDESVVDDLNLYAADAEVTVRPTADDTGAAIDRVLTVDGEKVRESTVVTPLDVGAVTVTVAVDPQIGITGGRATRYFILLALGTALLAIAAWTVIAERRRLERRATTDEMTGLLNRREFERQCDEAIVNADRFRTGLCVMLLDLDGFKSINDTLGHHFGDEVLIETAKRLRLAVRDTDVVGRWGGDEFVILLPGLEQTTAVRNSAERIGAGLSGTPVVGDVTVTGSIGAALYPRHGTTFDELIHGADGAMYGAKTTGVPHRLADALSLDDPGGAGVSYGGPDRRRLPSTGEPVG